MKNIKNILVPTDFSDNALNAFRYAIWFADYYEADIHVMHVVYPTAEPLDYPAMAAQMMQKQIEVAQELMKTFANSAMVQMHAGYEPEFVPNITSEVLAGTPQERVRELVEEKGFDLVIMGTQGKHSNFEKTFGSVAYGTMQKAPCPIMVIPEKATGHKIQTVAYATDFTEADPFYIWQVGKLLSPFNAIMRIVHIEKSPNEKRPLCMKDLENFFQDHPPGLQVTFHQIATKNIANELKEFEDTWNVDLMVMAKPHRGFFERLFHKSMTKRLALNTTTPLLVLKA